MITPMLTNTFPKLLCAVILFSAANLCAQYENEPPPIRTLEDSRAMMLPSDPNERDGEAARFARWEYRVTPRLRKGGLLPKPTILLEELQRYNARQAKNNNTLS